MHPSPLALGSTYNSPNVVIVFVTFLILISIHNHLKSHPSKVERSGENAVTFAKWPHEECPFWSSLPSFSYWPLLNAHFYPQSFEGGEKWKKCCDICRVASWRISKVCCGACLFSHQVGISAHIYMLMLIMSPHSFHREAVIRLSVAASYVSFLWYQVTLISSYLHTSLYL